MKTCQTQLWLDSTVLVWFFGADWPLKVCVVLRRRKHRRSRQLHLRRSWSRSAALRPAAASNTQTKYHLQDHQRLFDLPSKIMVTNEMFCSHRDGLLDVYVVFLHCLYIYFLYWNRPLICPPMWFSGLPFSSRCQILIISKYCSVFSLMIDSFLDFCALKHVLYWKRTSNLLSVFPEGVDPGFKIKDEL